MHVSTITIQTLNPPCIFPAIVVCLVCICLRLHSVGCSGNLTTWPQNKTSGKRDKESKLSLSSSSTAVILWSACYFHYWRMASWPSVHTHTETVDTCAQTEGSSKPKTIDINIATSGKNNTNVHPCTKKQRPVLGFLHPDPQAESTNQPFSSFSFLNTKLLFACYAFFSLFTFSRIHLCINKHL